MINQQVYSKDIVEFVTVGVEYCSLIEQATENDRKEFILKLVRILPLLYLKATLLPENQDEDFNNLEQYVTEEQYMYLSKSLSDVLGEQDAYLEVFDNDMAYSDTPLSATISENLADVYQDVRDMLEIYRIGNEELSQAAIGRCRNNFIEYWGQRLVNAMRPLHAICFDRNAEDVDDFISHDDNEDNNFLY